MEENNRYHPKIPSDAKINTSSPGTLAIERFKLAMAIEQKEQQFEENEDIPKQ